MPHLLCSCIHKQKKHKKIVLVTKPDVADDEIEVVSRKQLGVVAAAVDDWQLV